MATQQLGLSERDTEALAHPLFPVVDTSLRSGKHICTEDADKHLYISEYQLELERFYKRYSVELVRAPEDFFYLRTKSTSIIPSSQLSELEMLCGKVLVLLWLSPERLAQQGVFTPQEVFDELASLVPMERLVKIVNPRSTGSDLDKQKFFEKLRSALTRLARIGIISFLPTKDKTRMKFYVREACFRFGADVRTAENIGEMQQELINSGEAVTEASLKELAHLQAVKDRQEAQAWEELHGVSADSFGDKVDQTAPKLTKAQEKAQQAQDRRVEEDLAKLHKDQEALGNNGSFVAENDLVDASGLDFSLSNQADEADADKNSTKHKPTKKSTREVEAEQARSVVAASQVDDAELVSVDGLFADLLGGGLDEDSADEKALTATDSLSDEELLSEEESLADYEFVDTTAQADKSADGDSADDEDFDDEFDDDEFDDEEEFDDEFDDEDEYDDEDDEEDFDDEDDIDENGQDALDRKLASDTQDRGAYVNDFYNIDNEVSSFFDDSSDDDDDPFAIDVDEKYLK